jgi:hypothetical protein
MSYRRRESKGVGLAARLSKTKWLAEVSSIGNFIILVYMPCSTSDRIQKESTTPQLPQLSTGENTLSIAAAAAVEERPAKEEEKKD